MKQYYQEFSLLFHKHLYLIQIIVVDELVRKMMAQLIAESFHLSFSPQAFKKIFPEKDR
jgi:hypothetical protein